MISFPLLLREFRVAAQSKRTFLLRVLLGAILAFAVLVFIANRQSWSRWTVGGDYLLRTFAWELYMLILVAAPALTCGCIADEKKDGTLGLLLLTKLNSADIILGKFISRGVDLLLLLVSATPFLFAPILLGGVSWDQTFAVVINALSLLLLCLAMGIWCSTIAIGTAHAMGLAYFGLVLVNLAPTVLALWQSSSAFAAGFAGKPVILRWLELASPLSSLFQNAPRIAGTSDALVTLGCCATAAAVLLALSIWRLPSTLYGQPFRAPWLRRFGQAWFPTLRGLSIRRNRRALDRNPIRWLNLTRRSSWVLLPLLTAFLWMVWAAYLTEPSSANRALISLFNWVVPLIVKLMVIVTLARSFAAEKEDGSLELLLTTPVSERAIVKGKLLAALGRYGLLYLAIGSFRYFRYYHMLPSGMLLFQLVPVVADFFCSVCLCLLVSVWCRSVTHAILWAIGATLVVGWIFDLLSNALLGALGFGFSRAPIWFSGLRMNAITSFPKLFFNLIVACWAYRHLVKNLRAYAAR